MEDEFTVNLKEALAAYEEKYVVKQFRGTAQAERWTFVLLPSMDVDLLAQTQHMEVQRVELPRDAAGEVDINKVSAYQLTCVSAAARNWNLRRFVQPPEWLKQTWEPVAKEVIGTSADPMNGLPTPILEELAEAVRLKIRRSGNLLSADAPDAAERAAGK